MITVLLMSLTIAYSCRKRRDMASHPKSTYYSLTSNDSVSLERLNFEKIILFFIDTQCGFCELEVNEITDKQDALENIKVVLVGSNADSYFSALDSTGLDLWVTDSLSFQNVSLPTSFIIKDGVLLKKNEGWVSLKKIISQIERD